MLHIVNGDTVANTLNQGIAQGEIIVWRDILTEGPVGVNMGDPAFLEMRASCLEKTLGIPRERFIALSREQEQRLERFAEHGEVVLWFEHDLFDQTMLTFLLHWFSRRPLGKTKLHLLCIGEFPGIARFKGLGQLSAEQMASLYGTWSEIGREELQFGAKAWEAYAADDPRPLLELLGGENGGTNVLPFVRDAFRFHLTRFPSASNGLGWVEQHALELVRNGVQSPLELFREIGSRERWYGLGDLQFWAYLRRMSEAAHPLIAVDSPATFPNYADPAPNFAECRIRLTEAGRSVLDGAADHVVLNGIDRWLGGVHLQGQREIWRYDESSGTLVKF